MMAGVPTVAHAELPPARVDAIVDAVRSCAAATKPTGLDESALRADGWQPVSMSRDGKPVASSFDIYSKDNLLLIAQKQQDSPICAYSARLSSLADFTTLQAEFASRFGTPVKDDGKGEQTFIAPDHRIVDLASTGSRQRPAVRVAVGPVFQETK